MLCCTFQAAAAADRGGVAPDFQQRLLEMPHRRRLSMLGNDYHAQQMHDRDR